MYITHEAATFELGPNKVKVTGQGHDLNLKINHNFSGIIDTDLISGMSLSCSFLSRVGQSQGHMSRLKVNGSPNVAREGGVVFQKTHLVSL